MLGPAGDFARVAAGLGPAFDARFQRLFAAPVNRSGTLRRRRAHAVLTHPSVSPLFGPAAAPPLSCPDLGLDRLDAAAAAPEATFVFPDGSAGQLSLPQSATVGELRCLLSRVVPALPGTGDGSRWTRMRVVNSEGAALDDSTTLAAACAAGAGVVTLVSNAPGASAR